MKPVILLFLALGFPAGAFSQLSESFAGTEIVSNNPWEGDLEFFQINNAGQLQFVSPAGEAGEVVLHIPLSIGKNTEWEMDVMLDFKSTDANNLRIYVYTAEDLDFYIQAGNNYRQVSLYSQEAGKSPKRCIAGRNYLLDEPYSFVSIRLTLEDGKNWSLYTRKEGETAFYKEGDYQKAIDRFDEEHSFAFLYRYIKSRTSVYYINNIRVIADTSGNYPEPDASEEVNPDAGESAADGNVLPAGISSPVLREDGYYSISYELENAGYKCRAHVYNPAGARVAEIANHEQLSLSGQLLWDGKSLNGSRLHAGIYILFVELYHAGGESRHYKKAFLVK